MTTTDPARARLAVTTDDRSARHAAAGFHPERPERFDAARRALAALERPSLAVPARAATDDELARAHSPRHLDALAQAFRRGAGFIDADTYFNPATGEAARFAAGGACALVDALLDGRADVGVVAARPPGHHATRDRAMGFCLLNNVAVAAAHARARGAWRVAVVDWDVHHGNGTQDIFLADPGVVFVSLHQSPLYPGTGAAREVGEGEGRGATVNVPLPPGSTGATYAAAFDRLVLPVLAEAKPDVILVSAGFDAHARDPLASMRLEASDYAWMASRVRDVALALGHGRVALVLEGGYDLRALEESLHASAAALVDPVPGAALAPRPDDDAAELAIRDAIAAQRPYWPGAL